MAGRLREQPDGSLFRAEAMAVMRSKSDEVKPLTPGDIEWVLDLGGWRRQRIVSFAPRFWRPALNARVLRKDFLSYEIHDPQVLSIRTDHGFLFAVPRGEMLDVDDMALDKRHSVARRRQQAAACRYREERPSARLPPA